MRDLLSATKFFGGLIEFLAVITNVAYEVAGLRLREAVFLRELADLIILITQSRYWSTHHAWASAPCGYQGAERWIDVFHPQLCR